MPMFNSTPPPEPPPFKLNNFAGINLSVTPTEIADNESPDMLNITLDKRGQPDKRTGYNKVVASLGSGQINGIFEYNNKVLVAHGGNLYEFSKTEL